MSDQIATHKFTTTLSLILSVYGNVRYIIGKSAFGGKHSGFHVDDTPFTSNIIVLFVFWGILYFLQISFVAQIFFPAADNSVLTGTPGGNISRLAVTNVVGWHFTVFNFLQFIWNVLFANGHFFFSELVLIINFVNVIILYFSHKTYGIKPLSSWTLIHLPTAAFPLSWLLYAVFWNGAVLFHVHHLIGRIIANVLIWDFLIIPGFFLAVFNDWGVGFSSTLLVFGLALGQLFTKVIAFQWIFAFVISGLLLVLSIVTAVSGSLYHRELSSDTAPLLQESA